MLIKIWNCIKIRGLVVVRNTKTMAEYARKTITRRVLDNSRCRKLADCFLVLFKLF